MAGGKADNFLRQRNKLVNKNSATDLFNNRLLLPYVTVQLKYPSLIIFYGTNYLKIS